MDGPRGGKPKPGSHEIEQQPSCTHQQAEEQRRGSSSGLSAGAAGGCGRRRLQAGQRRLQRVNQVAVVQGRGVWQVGQALKCCGAYAAGRRRRGRWGGKR